MEKERRTKALLLSALVVVVATLSIAFAAMSRTLSINGIAKMDTASWSVYFNDLKGPNITRGAKQISAPSISVDKGTVQDINVKLSNPKDEISYTVDIVNDGTIDAEITMIKDIELTEVQKKVFEFKVTYTDTGEVLKDCDILPKKTTKNITINIKFKDDITEFDLPSESQTINLSYQITYTQYDGEIPVGPNGGVETVKSILNYNDTFENIYENGPTSEGFFNGTLARTSVESIDFLNSNVVPSEYETVAWDASKAQDDSIMAWYTDSDSNGLNEVYIGGNGGVAAPSDSSGMFSTFTSLKNINFNNNFDTSNTTNLSGMFSFCYALESLDLSGWDTSQVTDMSFLITDDDTEGMIITSINLAGWDTSNVTNMSYMFMGCSLVENLDISHFDTSQVTDMSWMFGACASLTNLNVTNFVTTNVTNMDGMFCRLSTVTSLNLNSFNTTQVTNMAQMFDGCESLISLNINHFDTSNVTDMSSMFSYCEALTELNLSSFDTSKVIRITQMFSHCELLEYLDLSNADFSKVQYCSEPFRNGNIPTTIIASDAVKNMLLTC